VRKQEGKQPFVRSMSKWEDIIKIYLKEEVRTGFIWLRIRVVDT
jgi:hypothetical protein